ncbi:MULTISPECIES: phage tail protein [unclassified Providencia]|uniref:phage tail protein n=1 Tax=unclassified Providencia TaxID=2633465 RepID=UPI002349873E|nr:MULTISPECIES: phage tail protein [unclassified Providencia]WOB99633.1 phage tail protein [Providencia sp. PROV046]
MKYFALLTKLGENLLAQATALGTKLELTHMAVGDGGGSLPTPDTNQTKLIAEKRRAAINTLFIDDKNKNQIIAEQIIPEQDGGWWIREIGLFDKAGNLIAVANCPETYKPQLAEGSGRTQSIRMVLIVSHTESVTLKIDPSVVLATREYVNTEITVIDKKIDALSAQTKLDLNKKFDKANISGQKGNDNDKVPSLNLFTTEIGKLAVIGYSYSKIESDGRYQPKGNYAPAGDYATNTALNGKLDKVAVVQSGGQTPTVVMSQKATTDALLKRLELAGGELTGTLKVQRVDTNKLTGQNKQLLNASGATVYLGNTDNVDALRLETSNGMAFVVRGANALRIYHQGFKPSADDVNAISTNLGYALVPVGASIIWNSSAPLPTNFWPNEGRSFSAAEYPELAKIFPSLKLPDDRGYAIRIADNGRGIDAGRTVGSYQEDAMRNINGTVKGKGLATTNGLSADGVFALNDTFTALDSQPGNTVWASQGFSIDVSRQVPTANEFRMKNVAKILITRVK